MSEIKSTRSQEDAPGLSALSVKWFADLCLNLDNNPETGLLARMK